MNILECHSRGNLNFSPFGANVRIGNVTKTIEDWYQGSKLKEDGTYCTDWKDGKGVKAVHYNLNGVVFENTSEEVGINVLTALWIIYLERNPLLVYELNLYDEFHDMFDKDSSPLSQASMLKRIRFSGLDKIREEVRDYYDRLNV